MSDNRKLLYLVHRLPYPPNKGDKISSWNLLKHLSAKLEGTWDVHLGTFVDDPDDQQYVEHVEQYCESLMVVQRNATNKYINSIRGLLAGEPLSVSFYASGAMKNWVATLFAQNSVDAVLLYSSAMARFVMVESIDDRPLVLVMDDVDSEKWRAYATSASLPQRLLYAREAQRLLAFERKASQAANSVVFISEDEAALFRSKAPEVADKVMARKQGIDTSYFDPERDYQDPYETNTKPIVFTGAMDYPPNINAVTWFVSEILPGVLAAEPQARFFIVGMRPTEEVQKLANLAGVFVTGAVPDVRPYMAHAYAACIPMRIARGVQNKVLEAMAMSLPVIATPEALTGISNLDGTLCKVASSAKKIQEHVSDSLKSTRQRDHRIRQHVLQEYDWQRNTQIVDKLLAP